jgi:RNase P subunit RPR2
MYVTCGGCRKRIKVRKGKEIEDLKVEFILDSEPSEYIEYDWVTLECDTCGNIMRFPYTKEVKDG